MLGYEEFKKVLRQEVQKFMKEEVYVQTVKKNNEQGKETLSFRAKEFNLIPSIHLKDLFEEFQSGKSMDECVMFVREVFGMNKQIQLDEVWGTWDEKKNLVRIRMINREWNRKQLEQIPHRIFCDLAVTFRIEYPTGKRSIVGYDINYQTLEYWGITEQELIETAFENLRQTEYTICDLELLGEPQKEQTSGRQYVMTNSNYFYGAAGILRTDLLSKFAEEHDCDFYILPSSVHECLFIPDSEEIPADELREMVREVNATQVEVEERLSDEVYYFEKEIGKLKIA